MLQAKVIKDSLFNGERLTTFEVEFHRFILPELNTHRVFSRNYQSSRAVPVQALIDQVRHDPAIPVHWGKNQTGMIADEECDSLVTIMDYVDTDSPVDGIYEEKSFRLTPQEAWEVSACEAAEKAEAFHNAGYHKQVVNRLLEPFMWTRGVVTATDSGLSSFFKLRCHPAAQPEIQALAYLMKDDFDKSVPIELKPGEWHLPYIDSTKGTEDNIKISTSCVAQVSYRRLDDSIKKANKIYDMLNLPSKGVFSNDPPHFSPAEHVAMALESDDLVEITSEISAFARQPYQLLSPSDIGGNFQSVNFYQYRKMLEQGVEKQYM